MTENPDSPDPEGADAQESAQGEPRFSFTDKRKVDPADGSVRPVPSDGNEQDGSDPIDAEAAELFEEAARDQADPSAPQDQESSRVTELEKQVADLGEELKRAQAEYVNSRRRIENAAQADTQAAVARVLASLISVLDDVELGRQHGDIAEGTPFGSIVTKLEDTLRGQGLERYGDVGDEFDPNIHEALMHEPSEEHEVNTVKMVMQPGYKVGDRVVRPARVATHGPQ